MTDKSAPQMSEQDLTDFARQLYEWTKSLPEVQQGLLHRILSRAASAGDDDTSGYALGWDRRYQFSAFAGLFRAALGSETEEIFPSTAPNSHAQRTATD